VEYLQLWDTISAITLNSSEDIHLWRFEASLHQACIPQNQPTEFFWFHHF
jgi:hypothetical protein